MFPFGTLNNQNFSSFVLNEKNANSGSSINLKPTPNLSLLFNQFNDLSPGSINKNLKNMISCKYYDTNDIQKITTKPKCLSLLHLNTCSLNKNYLEYLIKTTNQTCDVIAISESRSKVI